MIAKVGLLILFFGLAFLLKYAAERNLIPVEFRVASVAVVGIAMVIIGWRLRERARGYALSLQGGGIAVMYLTTFGALRLYHLIPPEMAFALLVAIAAFSAFMAIAQDALVLAAFGAGGGFLAPILASTGGGSHVMLFSYYVILNAGILAIAFFKAWRPLNLMGFLFTFIIGLAWGLKYYRPEYRDSTEPFLVAFFLMYVAIQILFTRHRAPGTPRVLDGMLVFGTPLAAFGLQAALMRDTEFGLSYSCLAASAMYLALAWIMRKRGNPDKALLVEAYFALGVVFATVAIPFALDARWTSAAWSVEGAAIVWFGIRQKRALARAFGFLLQPGAAIAYVIAYPGIRHADIPIVDAAFVGALLLAVAGLWIARLIARNAERLHEAEVLLEPAAFLWGMLWLLFGAHHEIEEFIVAASWVPAQVAVVAAAALVFLAISRRLEWRVASWPALALLPLLVVALLASAERQPHPFAAYGWAAWIFAMGVQAWILRRDPQAPPLYVEGLHAGTMVMLAVLGAMELHWLAVEHTAPHTAWSVASVIVVPALVVLLVSTRWARTRWPVARIPVAYRVDALVPLAIAMLLWSLYANATHDGTSDPLPYLPLLNALDLGHILAGLALLSAWLAHRHDPVAWPIPPRWNVIVIAAIAFIWLNGVLLRSLHHWADVPYTAHAMWHTTLVQAALSIFWSLLAVALMVAATRTARRALWLVGAILMGVVVVKLFIIDLSNVGGIYRVISFIGVGVLMLLVGYFSPVPPRAKEAQP